MQPGERHEGLDRLKAGVTLLVVLHHTAITYGAMGGWFYRELQPDGSPSSLLLVLFCTLNQAWFMGLFFLLAGYFTPGAIERKTAGAFVRDRLLRLGLPLLAFGLLLGPLTIALVQHTLRDRAVGDVFAALWQRRQFENGPLWFVQALLIFSGVALLWHRLRPRAPSASPFPSNLALLLAALLCGAVAVVLRLWWPVGKNVWGLQLGYFASYVLLFRTGYAAAQRGWLEQLTRRAPLAQVRLWRNMAWLALPVLAVPMLLAQVVPAFAGDPTGGWSLPALLYAFWEPFVAWGVILVLLARAVRPGAPASSPLWQRLSRRAYAIFVIHPLPVVAIALAWRHVQAPALIKFAVTGSLACVACYVIAGLLLRVPGIRRVL
ncbi:MAG: acyltransferase family protein [Rhizobacter sp.]